MSLMFKLKSYFWRLRQTKVAQFDVPVGIEQEILRKIQKLSDVTQEEKRPLTSGLISLWMKPCL